ncbi:MAG TPA: FAD-dependent oxidoreductase [Chloroflexota bacterium]
MAQHQMRPNTVAIVGGGVAGLSAAHELAERGFQVTVYERSRTTGGKARSIFVPGSGLDGRRDLPGEHGFRFFPSFYRHLPDTMQRIPFGGNPNGVADNLVATSRTRLARIDAPPVDVLTRFPSELRDVSDLVRMVVKSDLDLPRQDMLFVGKLFLTLLTSCKERRFGHYEHAPWWEFVEADKRSPEFRKYFCDVAVRSLVAMCPRRASTRTTGVIGMQIWIDHARPGAQVDRLLNGPTHDAWITPWRRHLERLGVRFEFGAAASQLHIQDGRITSVELADGRQVHADYFVAAVPVERMAGLASAALKEADPSLAHLDRLHTEWMNGIQFFLDRKMPLVHGHLALVDAPWALTAVAQKQFWPHTNLANFGNGRTREVLSVIISNWDVPGTFVGKPARECSRDEIQAEVWAQIKAHVNSGGRATLGDSALVDWYLADSIEHRADGSVVNHEPLLINTAGSWAHRPDAVTRIPNLFLAADYVRTNTDIATMESANEAARRAVNGILDAAGAPGARCKVWELEEPAVFKPLQMLDRVRLQRGQPHLLGLSGAAA